MVHRAKQNDRLYTMNFRKGIVHISIQSNDFQCTKTEIEAAYIEFIEKTI